MERAQQSDESAYAEAIRAGKPKPKPTVTAAEKKKREADAEEAALRRAAEAAAHDAVEAFDQYGQARADDLRQELAEKREAAVRAISEVQGQIADLERTRQVIAYLGSDTLRSWQRVTSKLGRLPRAKMARREADPTVGELLDGALGAVSAVEADTPKVAA